MGNIPNQNRTIAEQLLGTAQLGRSGWAVLCFVLGMVIYEELFEGKKLFHIFRVLADLVMDVKILHHASSLTTRIRCRTTGRMFNRKLS